MFTDIDNFTQLSEKMSSKEIIELLSEYQYLKILEQLINLLEIL